MTIGDGYRVVKQTIWPNETRHEANCSARISNCCPSPNECQNEISALAHDLGEARKELSALRAASRTAALQAFRRWYIYVEDVNGANERLCNLYIERFDKELAALLPVGTEY